MLGDSPAWLGKNYLDGKDSWVWSDGSSWVYTNWDMHEPNSLDGEHCLEIDGPSGRKWNDVSCNRKVKAICEKHNYYIL